MTAVQISSKKKWEKAHTVLNGIFEKEIELMREVLASLHQEELALMEQDLRRFKRVMYSRSSTVIHLKNLREKRMQATAELTKLAVTLKKAEILPHEEESSCAVLSKLDQLVALLERINLQNCRNEVLFGQMKHRKTKPIACAYPHPLHKVRKRTSVATYGSK